METIVLVIHLIIALAIIGLVMVQRSSGGGLGIGGSGGGMGDFASARGTANALTKLTTYFALAFFITSLTLAYMAGHKGSSSVLDALEAEQAQVEAPVSVEPAEPEVPTGE